MERWSIEITKEYLKFSAAHFLIFPNGEAERLHGHNYRVSVEVGGTLTDHGMVMDFKEIKPRIRKLLDAWDERWLVPGEHPELKVYAIEGGHVEVVYRESTYRAPSSDVLVLPVNNTSTENLAALLGRRLWEELEAAYPDVDLEFLRLAVEETAGQRGVYHHAPGEAGGVDPRPGGSGAA